MIFERNSFKCACTLMWAFEVEKLYKKLFEKYVFCDLTFWFECFDFLSETVRAPKN
jgi:hypothetical protein